MSKTAVEINDCSWFFQKAAAADKRALLLDYDGTVAPFCVDRRRAFPYPAVPELLRTIMNSCRTRLVIITGRAAHTVAPLLQLEPSPETWGTYGLERLHPDGRYEGPEVSDEALDALGQIESELQSHNLGDLIEARPGGVSVHWRGLPAARILEVRTIAYRTMNTLAPQTGLLVADFDGGVEIRLRSANKGDVVRTILAEEKDGTPIAYLGDDTADEDAFRVLNSTGLTALVRPKHRFTAAQMWLRPPQELAGFLKDWIKACGGAL